MDFFCHGFARIVTDVAFHSELRDVPVGCTGTSFRRTVPLPPSFVGRVQDDMGN